MIDKLNYETMAFSFKYLRMPIGANQIREVIRTSENEKEAKGEVQMYAGRLCVLKVVCIALFVGL